MASVHKLKGVFAGLRQDDAGRDKKTYQRRFSEKDWDIYGAEIVRLKEVNKMTFSDIEKELAQRYPAFDLKFDAINRAYKKHHMQESPKGSKPKRRNLDQQTFPPKIAQVQQSNNSAGLMSQGPQHHLSEQPDSALGPDLAAPSIDHNFSQQYPEENLHSIFNNMGQTQFTGSAQNDFFHAESPHEHPMTYSFDELLMNHSTRSILMPEVSWSPKPTTGPQQGDYGDGSSVMHLAATEKAALDTNAKVAPRNPLLGLSSNDSQQWGSDSDLTECTRQFIRLYPHSMSGCRNFVLSKPEVLDVPLQFFYLAAGRAMKEGDQTLARSAFECLMIVKAHAEMGSSQFEAYMSDLAATEHESSRGLPTPEQKKSASHFAKCCQMAEFMIERDQRHGEVSDVQQNKYLEPLGTVPSK